MKDELEDLEKPDNWDFDNAVEHPPVRGRRAIVSVAFPRDDFQLVSGTAAQLGMKTSEFIRKAAIDKASTSAEILSIAWIGGTAGQFHRAPSGRGGGDSPLDAAQHERRRGAA